MKIAKSFWILGLIAVLAGGAFWLLRGSDSIGPENHASQTANADGHGSGAARDADVADETVEDKGADGSRVSIDTKGSDPALEQGPAITGRVVDKSGVAIEGAEILGVPDTGMDWTDPDAWDPDAQRARTKLAMSQMQKTQTAADGSFKLRVGGSGKRLSILARSSGHQRAWRSAKRPTDADVDVGVITLELAAIVSGKVVDRLGKPVVDARVTVASAGSYSNYDFADDADFENSGMTALWNGECATDAEGQFQIDNAATGAIVVVARHIDHPLARLEGLKVDPGTTLSDVVVVVEPGVSITGKVTDIPDGTKGLRVTATVKRSDAERRGNGIVLDGDFGPFYGDWQQGNLVRRSTRVAADGSFVVRGLKASTVHELIASQRMRGFGRESTCSQKLEVLSGATDVRLPFEAGASVTMQVVDDASGQPIESLWVDDSMRDGARGGMWYGPQTRVRPREYPEGKVILANLRPEGKQKLSLDIEAIGYAKYSRDSIEVPTVGVLDLGVIRLKAQPVLRVHVSDLTTGEPVVGAFVSAREVKENQKGRRDVEAYFADFSETGRVVRELKTDEDGNVVLNAFPGSKCKVRVRGDDYAPYTSDPIDLPDKRDAEHQVKLGHGATVEVHALDANGEILANARVDRSGSDDSNDSRSTNDKGVATYEHLVPGKHSFRIRRRNDGDQQVEGLYRASQASSTVSLLPGSKELELVEGAKFTIELQKEPVAKLHGVISENGKALEHASITVLADVQGDGTDKSGKPRVDTRQIGRARTNNKGEFDIDDLPVGDFRLRISHNDRAMSAEVPVPLHLGLNPFDCDLDTTILRGFVRDPAGRPVAGASINVAADSADASNDAGNDGPGMFFQGPDGMVFSSQSRGSRARTNDDGSYELRGVTPSVRLIVSASAKGLLPGKSLPVEIGKGQTREGVDIGLAAAGTVVVRTSVERNGARIIATFQGTEPKGVAKARGYLRDGTATLDPLVPGTWSVMLTPRGETAITRTVEVAAGQTVTVDF